MRALDVGLLPALVTAAKQEYEFPPNYCVIYAITRSQVDSHLEQTAPKRLTVAEVPCGQAINAYGDLRLSACIRKLRKPVIENVSAGCSDVVPNLDH